MKNGTHPEETFTFRDGTTVKLLKVNPYRLNAAKNSVKKPPPPKNKVDYGNGPVWEDNPYDPDYLDNLKMWEAEKAMAALMVMLRFGIEFKNKDAIQKAVDKVRDEMLEIGIEIEKDTNTAYILYCLEPTQTELTNLAQAIARMSTVTEAAVADAVASF